jgi:hypothetical protein
VKRHAHACNNHSATKQAEGFRHLESGLFPIPYSRFPAKLLLMVEMVARQQELRLRLLVGAYQEFLRDPNAFLELTKLDFGADPGLERPDSDDDDAPAAPRVDFAVQPATPAEARAAAFYLLERGLLGALPREALEAQKLEPNVLMLHVTAAGIDALETFVMTNHARALERPVGFRTLEADAERMLGMPLAQARVAGGGKL